MADNDLDPVPLLDLVRGFMRSRLLHVAVEVDLFTVLAEGPLSVDALRERLGLHPRGARDFFDALVAIGLLDRRDGSYANTPAADRFLDRGKPSYLGGAVEHAGGWLYPAWGRLADALRTGTPPRIGPDDWGARYDDAAFLRVFPQLMTAQSAGWTSALAGAFPWANYQTFVDLGTAQARFPSGWPSPTRTSTVSVSTCRPSGRCSRSTSRSTV